MQADHVARGKARKNERTERRNNLYVRSHRSERYRTPPRVKHTPKESDRTRCSIATSYLNSANWISGSGSQRWFNVQHGRNTLPRLRVSAGWFTIGPHSIAPTFCHALVFAERVKEISSLTWPVKWRFNGHCAQNCDIGAHPVATIFAYHAIQVEEGAAARTYEEAEGVGGILTSGRGDLRRYSRSCCPGLDSVKRNVSLASRLQPNVSACAYKRGICIRTCTCTYHRRDRRLLGGFTAV